MDLIVFDYIEVFSSQLKRFNESVVDQKCFLKGEATSFCFDNNLSFSSNIIFPCILLFLSENHGLHTFQNDFELQSTQVSQITEIWLIYSDLSPGFVVA